MSAIGSLVFCNDCNNLLTRNYTATSTYLTCDVCGAECQGDKPNHLVRASPDDSDTAEKVITTRSKPDAFPSALRAKRSNVQTLEEDDMNKGAIIRENCDTCGKVQDVAFYTQQLRSADEGSTVFYTCQTCGTKWTVNN